MWPTAQTKTNFDAGTDDPKQARSEFAGNVDKFNLLQAHVSSFMQTFLARATAALGRTDLELGTAALKNTGTSGDALGLLNASVNWSNAFLLSGTISPSQITANQNNYNPSGLSGAVQLRLNSDASRNITGLAGGAGGRLLMVANIGSTDIVLVNQSASSTAGNRFLFADGDRTLTADESVLLRYDGTSSRWRAAQDTKAAGEGLVALTPFTASGTWTPHADGTSAIIFCTAGGGGGGGAGGSEASGGGAGGSTAIDFVADTTGISSETVTIGSGGGGDDGTSDGSAGGTSSVGSLASAGGGAGGKGGTATSSQDSAGGTATVGDLLIRGGGGSGASSDGANPVGGDGGGTFWGGGPGGSGGPGTAGAVFGAGGSGGDDGGDGGNGKDGVVLILEW